MIKINHDYYVVELTLFSLPSEVAEWLQSRLGPGDGNRWMYRSPNLYFSNKTDHTMFLLRWG